MQCVARVTFPACLCFHDTEKRGLDKGLQATCDCEYNSQMPESDLSALSAFVVVAEERGFTRAARRLGVSPSAMSHAMRNLEEGLGVRLL